MKQVTVVMRISSKRIAILRRPGPVTVRPGPNHDERGAPGPPRAKGWTVPAGAGAAEPMA